MDRLLTIIFLLLIGVFALGTSGEIQRAILTGGIISAGFCGAAFVLKILTFRGAAAATVLGTITFGLGGWPVVIALLSFFLSSALISKNHSDTESQVVRRDGRQVWANGFWLACWLMVGVSTGHAAFRLAAFAVIATATADTWATELGSQRFKVNTYLASSGQVVAPGRQGGVSGPGLAASLAGSGFIALIFYLGAGTVGWLFAVLAAGMAGSLIDSLLGATLQGQTYHLGLGQISSPVKINIDNNMVNWLSTGLSSLLILILNLIVL